MPFLTHFKEIEMIVLKEVVRYSIPLYFEAAYLDTSRYTVRRQGPNLILEFPVKEKCITPIETNAEKGRETVSRTLS
jgi:hypothetical protein